MELLLYDQILRKMNLQPTGFSFLTSTTVHFCAQLCISPPQVRYGYRSLQHQLCNNLTGHSWSVFLLAVIIHLLELLHIIGIHKYQLHFLGLVIVSEHEPVVACCLPFYKSFFFQNTGSPQAAPTVGYTVRSSSNSGTAFVTSTLHHHN